MGSQVRNVVTSSANWTGYWKRKPWPASGYTRSRASGMWSARICELMVGIIVSLAPLATRVG